MFFHKLGSHFGCCRWNQLNEFRSSQHLSSLSTLFRESQLLLTQYGSNKWFCFSLFTPRKEQASGRWREIIRTDIFRLWGAIDRTLSSVLWFLLHLLQAGWALVWLDTGSRSIDQCWSQTCVLAKISQGALRKCIFLGLAIMLRKPPNFQVWLPRTNVFKSPLGPTNTDSGWKLVNSQIYISSPDISSSLQFSNSYNVFNIIYLLVCLLIFCLPIFSFPQHILNSKSYKDRNLICSMLCAWHLEECLAHKRASINAC